MDPAEGKLFLNPSFSAIDLVDPIVIMELNPTVMDTTRLIRRDGAGNE